jgi:hypothetical protein
VFTTSAFSNGDFAVAQHPKPAQMRMYDRVKCVTGRKMKPINVSLTCLPKGFKILVEMVRLYFPLNYQLRLLLGSNMGRLL